MREERFECSIRDALRLRDPPRVPVPTMVIRVVNRGILRALGCRISIFGLISFYIV